MVLTWGRWKGDFWFFADGEPVEKLTRHGFEDLSQGYLRATNAKLDSEVSKAVQKSDV